MVVGREWWMDGGGCGGCGFEEVKMESAARVVGYPHLRVR